MARGLKADVRVDGLTEARATMAALPQAFKDVAGVTIALGAAIIEAEAKRRVPVRSEALKKSIGTNLRGDSLQAAVGAGLVYAKFVEFGTGDTPAQPFLYPAYRRGARYVRKQMREWANEAGMQARFKTKRGRKPKAAAT